MQATDVVLIHGYTGTGRIWETVTPLLPRVFEATAEGNAR